VNASPVQLVIFDLGRVLLRICDDVAHACRTAGVPEPGAQMTPEQREVAHKLVCDHEVGKLSDEDYCRGWGDIIQLDPRHIAAMLGAYILGPYPGAVELVDDLKRAGVKTACLSNTNACHWRLMYDPTSPAYFPLDRMDWQFASQLIGARKPDPAIYEYVEKTTQIAPARIVFFDDRAENVGAARSRGWNAHQVTDAEHPVAQMRDHLRVHDLICMRA
jgi:FMN phosphatase YigB (HAD superfamily)